MDASIMQISYPAPRRGVEIARMPSGAVASMLEKDATKNTIFFDDFTAVPFVVLLGHKSNAKVRSKGTNRSPGICLRIVKTLQNPTERKPLSQISFQALSYDESVTTLRSAGIS
jgi:hypothetical protein